MSEFIEYLQSKNVVFFICTAVLAQQVLLTCDTIITSIIFPIVNKIFFNNRLNKEHFIIHTPTQNNSQDDIYITIADIHFNMSKITFTIIRLIIIMLILNFLYSKYS